MATTAIAEAPLLDGRFRGVVVGFVFAVLALMTVDGALTWLAADEGTETIDTVLAANQDRYPAGIDDRGLLLNDEDRAVIAGQTDGDRLDRDTITSKTVLAVVAVIAAVALALASAPGSSRNVLAAVIVIAAVVFFAPIYVHHATIDQVTTSHGG